MWLNTDAENSILLSKGPVYEILLDISSRDSTQKTFTANGSKIQSQKWTFWRSSLLNQLWKSVKKWYFYVVNGTKKIPKLINAGKATLKLHLILASSAKSEPRFSLRLLLHFRNIKRMGKNEKYFVTIRLHISTYFARRVVWRRLFFGYVCRWLTTYRNLKYFPSTLFSPDQYHSLPMFYCFIKISQIREKRTTFLQTMKPASFNSKIRTSLNESTVSNSFT